MRIRSAILLAAVGSLLAATAAAAIDVEGVYEDAKVIRRVAEVSRRGVPQEVLQTLAERAVDELRGKRDDGSFEYARYEAVEASRVSDRFTIRRHDADRKAQTPEGEVAVDERPLRMTELKLSADLAYRVILSAPSRRLLVSRNQRVFVDRIEATFRSFAGGERSATIPVGEWIEPGRERQINLPEITRSATVIVLGSIGADEGTASLDVALVQASLVDRADSPYAGAVRNARELIRAIEKNDPSATRRLAGSLIAELEPKVRTFVDVPPPRPAVEVTPPAIVPGEPPAAARGREEIPSVEIYMELQAIEDLLTGSEAERREGLDQLHQLIRKLRPRSNFE